MVRRAGISYLELEAEAKAAFGVSHFVHFTYFDVDGMPCVVVSDDDLSVMQESWQERGHLPDLTTHSLHAFLTAVSCPASAKAVLTRHFTNYIQSVDCAGNVRLTQKLTANAARVLADLGVSARGQAKFERQLRSILKRQLGKLRTNHQTVNQNVKPEAKKRQEIHSPRDSLSLDIDTTTVAIFDPEGEIDDEFRSDTQTILTIFERSDSLGVDSAQPPDHNQQSALTNVHLDSRIDVTMTKEDHNNTTCASAFSNRL